MHLSRFHLVLLNKIFGTLEMDLDPETSTPSDGAHLPSDTKPIHIHTPNGQPLPAQQDIPAGTHNQMITPNIYIDSTRFG